VQLDRLLRPALGLQAWARRYLAPYFTKPASALHRWLTGELNTLHLRRGTRLDIIAPRGAAKSTWASFAYPLWVALHGHERYIEIISDTTGQAWLWLEAIRNELETNEGLAGDYPDVCGTGDVWRQERIRLRNGVLIEALGTGSKIRGRRNRAERPSLIIVDDPENEDHVTSPDRREKTWRWFTRAVMNAGTPQTNILVLGTTLQRECLVLRLAAAPGWQARTFKAIEEWPVRMDLWAHWESILHDWENPDREKAALAFYEANRAEMER
jgi:hypothetical protein